MCFGPDELEQFMKSAREHENKTGGPVPYVIRLKPGESSSAAKSHLESMTDMYVTGVKETKRGAVITGHAQRETYEQVFDTTLRLETYTRTDVQRGNKFQVHEWRANTELKTPQGLEGSVRAVYLPGKRFPF